jgi:hypothetical protein
MDAHSVYSRHSSQIGSRQQPLVHGHHRPQPFAMNRYVGYENIILNCVYVEKHDASFKVNETEGNINCG